MFTERRPTAEFILFGFLTIGFLSAHGLHHLGWALVNQTGKVLFCISLLAIVWLGKEFFKKQLTDSQYVRVLLLYVLLIVSNGAFHLWGLLSLPEGAMVNVQGYSREIATASVLNLMVFYLSFPAMLLISLFLCSKLSLRSIVRWLAAGAALSVVVVLYQVYVDANFMRSLHWLTRYEGMATDPNAWSMTGFLLMAFLLAGVALERNKTVQLMYVGLLVLLFVAVSHAGARTAMSGMLLFLLFIPLVVALVKRGWTLRLRLLVGGAPLMAIMVAMLFASSIASTLSQCDGVWGRLAHTWQLYEKDGLSGVFVKGDLRGKLYKVAVELTEKSPLAGWGPGGYYREFSNIMYRDTGQKEIATDSPLNHYLMISSDFGLIVLFLNLILIVSPIILGMMVLNRIDEERIRYVTALFIFADIIFLMVCMAIPPSYFPEVQWVWSIQLALLLLIAKDQGMALAMFGSRAVMKRELLFAAIAVILVAWGCYNAVFGGLGYAARNDMLSHAI